MGTKRSDRTGEVHGSVSFIRAINASTWLVHWACCGKTQIVTNSRAGNIAKTTPLRCLQCVRGIQTKPARPHKRVVVKEGGLVVGGRWFPFLVGPMGPRFGRGATYDH